MRTYSYLEAAIKRTQFAYKRGALVPLETTLLDDVNNKFSFEVRKLVSHYPLTKRIYGPRVNPFKPWDSNLLISGINETHALILNKYPVQKGHMLLVTNKWKPQNGWISEDDWIALSKIDSDSTGLWFYNSCPSAGASQPHRHIQLLASKDTSKVCPRDHVFMNFLNKNMGTGNVKKLGYCVERRPQVIYTQQASSLYNSYLLFAEKLGLGSPSTESKPLKPYNLLISPKWFTMIVRKNEYFKGFSINALGFAGYLLATEASNLKWLNEYGPEALLDCVIDKCKYN